MDKVNYKVVTGSVEILIDLHVYRVILRGEGPLEVAATPVY